MRLSGHAGIAAEGAGQDRGLGCQEEADGRKSCRSVRFMPLLESALKQGVLRQAGAVYQFRHADLQDRLAARYERDRSTPSGERMIVDVRSATADDSR